MAIADEITDELIERAFNVQRFAETARRNVYEVLFELQDQLADTIDRLNVEGVVRQSFKFQRVERMLGEIRGIIKEKFREAGVILTDQMIDLGRAQGAVVARVLNEAVGADIFSFNLTRREMRGLVNDTVVYGGKVKDWWAKQSTDLARNVSNQIRMGVAAGETDRELIERVIGARIGSERIGGAMESARRDATALVRTATNAIANAALMRAAQDNAELVRGVQWISVMDNVTSAICRSRHLSAWDLDGNPFPGQQNQESFPTGQPPAHFNCRSTLSVVLKDADEIETDGTAEQRRALADLSDKDRQAIDGEPVQGLTFEQWLGRRSVAEQKALLGPGKWQLWQDGKITLSQMLDQSGNPLTLAELQRAGKRSALSFAPDDEVRQALRLFQRSDPLYKTTRAREKALYDAFARMKAQISAAENAAIRSYQSGDYQDINALLRSLKAGAPLPSGQREDLLQRLLLKQPPLERDTIVYRFFGSGMRAPTAGEVITLKGFTSTSSVPLTGFLSDASAGFEILLPAGSRGILTGFNPEQFEYLLPHESKFRVIAQKTLSYRLPDGVIVERPIYQLEYLSPEM